MSWRWVANRRRPRSAHRQRLLRGVWKPPQMARTVTKAANFRVARHPFPTNSQINWILHKHFSAATNSSPFRLSRHRQVAWGEVYGALDERMGCDVAIKS